MSVADIPGEKVPFSTEAVNTLLALEREHGSFKYGEKCFECLPDQYSFPRYWGYCPAVSAARAVASEETLVAVALMLNGERL